MADYWKSQPRKFCQYCKCWIADNKPSVEFHERGKNHKENVAAKITEIKKKSVEKAKQEERMSKQFAAMEEAAMKAYQEDLKRMGMESGSVPQAQTVVQQPIPQPKLQPRPQVPPPTKKQQKKKPSKMSRDPKETQIWVEGKTDDGNTYYYNKITGDSQWERPGGIQGGRKDAVQPGQKESSSGSLWMEALSPDGFTYYYNTQTGVSIWEKPADFPCNEASGSSSGSSKEGESQEGPSTSQPELSITQPETSTSQPGTSTTQLETSTTQLETSTTQMETSTTQLETSTTQLETSTTQPEPLPGGEESSNGAQTSQVVEVTEQPSQQRTVTKFSFKKRKTPLAKKEEDKASGDAPQEDSEEKKKEKEVQRPTTEPDRKKVVTQAKRRKTTNPYGAWEEIQEEEDPYASVDLELPQVEGEIPTTSAELPPEPKPKFKERIITSLGVEGGPASFKKSKTQNGKSRSLRQRDNGDDDD